LAGLCLCLGPVSTGFAQEALTPADFHPVNPDAVKVGRLLFYDPILSGNRNIACATCHHPDHGTSDGLSLGVGEGGSGLGPQRKPTRGADRIVKRVPRNAPGLWNLGARDIRVLFLDGRLSASDYYPSGFNSPAEEDLPHGLTILAAQALFPITAQFEMVGHREENEVAMAANRRLEEAWPLIAKRVRTIPAYADMLMAAYPEVSAPEDIDITHVVRALADFMAFEFQSIDSPFDRYLGGDAGALTAAQERGMALFFGTAGCSGCHTSKLLSDQDFHALALPPVGPGRTRRFDPRARDVGRLGETDRLEDAYRFRTPMLRNVALTAPYGHDGAYRTLAGIVRHHLDPLAALDRWRPAQAVLTEAPWLAAVDFVTLGDRHEMGRLRARVDIAPVALSEAQVSEIVAFLEALTGTDSIRGRLGVPDSVPSGLELDR
jgi:cytochrome c peroxidase